MKKHEIKRAVIVIICVVLAVVIIKLLQNRDTTYKDLLNLGYTDSDITIMMDKLNEDEIEFFVNREYNEYLPKVLNNDYYIPNHLQKYLELCKSNKDIDDVIAIINTGSDKDFYTFTKEVTNLSNSMLVNKFNYLPADYAPTDIESIRTMYAYSGHSIKSEVYDQFIKMWKDAQNEGLSLIINSSYRTFEEQNKIYNSYNDDYASRPGFSEHQTGLALDIVKPGYSGSSFESTDEFRWLKNNAYKYGFILRYPKNKEHITGYEYESWHYRYLGVDLATKVYQSGLTYEEYYAYYCEYKGEC